MSIIIKNRSQYAEDDLNKTIKELNDMQQEVVSEIEKALTMLISIESLYEIRDYIDKLIVNWQDEEIDLEED
jgi:hypothetical protein